MCVRTRLALHIMRLLTTTACCALTPCGTQAALRKMNAEDGGTDPSENLNETNYDEFSGYGGSLFAKGK